MRACARVWGLLWIALVCFRGRLTALGGLCLNQSQSEMYISPDRTVGGHLFGA